ncbi:DHHC zinc finger protein (macronuclear) [Tetrahymena thermophila SB210]|uniref:Palmitoyltransferase n=1 Tax=Tetrahymena thermophila (strain SB210) TaxID=312017 RepID=I7M815_TETTS|nr:DHHC zinc finger protein [Tetrahymena thermophila SB210]EAR96423.2 DHHC zinc finger protein [Tetrahymena thermophila SB210]|eukprot:XP_001016668.2 DHHC zinc finger protein [Tetrahymena thermophila SB210]
MDQVGNIPKWFAIGVILVFTGYIAIVYDVIFLRYLLQQNTILGVIGVVVFNLFGFFTYKSYYLTITTSPVFNAGYINEEYRDQLEQIKLYAKKSNAIIHTRRLRKNRFLFDTSQIRQQQLAYCDDITDLFDNQQNLNQQNNDQGQASQVQQGDAGNRQKMSYVNEPNEDVENRRAQIQQNQNQDITISQQNNSQNAIIFTEEEYKNFDVYNDLTQIKYCFKCQSVKPPRVHHCKICNRCINRMDHHCPWVANCVGKQNQKYFTIFLLYGSLCGLIVSLSVFIDFMFFNQVILKQTTDYEHQNLTVAGSASFPAFLVAYGLFLYQIVIGCRNLTTLEANIDGMYTEKNPFRKSSNIENMKEIFGEKILYWFIPIQEVVDKEKKEGFIQLVRD